MKRIRQQKKGWMKEIEDGRARKNRKIKIPLLESDSEKISWVAKYKILQKNKIFSTVLIFYHKLNSERSEAEGRAR